MHNDKHVIDWNHIKQHSWTKEHSKQIQYFAKNENLRVSLSQFVLINCKSGELFCENIVAKINAYSFNVWLRICKESTVTKIICVK